MSELARCSAARLLLLLPVVFLVLALLGGARHAGGASVCDTANCGKGNCSETPAPALLPPGYECNCDPGWSHVLELIPFSPCIVPNCSFDSACLKLNLSQTPAPPTDVCAVVSCGAGGACKAGAAPFSYSCECRPGYANLLNLTALPCVNCFLGSECYDLGLGPPPPAPAPLPAPAPSGDHGPAGPSPPPSGTK
ncbi:hypothetical protein ACJX0J_009359, partial [Zea mays]